VPLTAGFQLRATDTRRFSVTSRALNLTQSRLICIPDATARCRAYRQDNATGHVCSYPTEQTQLMPTCRCQSQRYVPRITRHALPVRACLKYAVPWRACLRHAGLRQGAQPTHSTCADRHGTVNTRRHSAGPPTVLTGRLVHCALYTARATSCTNQQPSHHAPDETKEEKVHTKYAILSWTTARGRCIRASQQLYQNTRKTQHKSCSEPKICFS